MASWPTYDPNHFADFFQHMIDLGYVYLRVDSSRQDGHVSTVFGRIVAMEQRATAAARALWEREPAPVVDARMQAEIDRIVSAAAARLL
jgi:hypothetical protein